MRYVVVIVSFSVILIGVGMVGLNALQQKIDSALSQQPEQKSLSPTPSPTHVPIGEVTKDIFIPYWGLPSGAEAAEEYAKLIYFGVEIDNSGLDKEEQGYQSLTRFIVLSEGKEKILTIRMINSETNFAILKDKKMQQRVIEQSIALARQHGFDGVLLNLELSALPFESLIGQIRTFNRDFYVQAKKNKLSYGITAYGDTFFRVRPFDIEDIAQHTDQIYIMAYDFHKAKGNPGPNFPLKGAESYGYDMEKMADNFLSYIPGNKVTVVFGLYGYDWQVDDKDISQGIAEPITLKEAKPQLIDNCSYLSCEWRRDQVAGEIEVKYTDDNDKKHIVWFEDTESVKRKEEFLKKRGISSFAYWAYSYF